MLKGKIQPNHIPLNRYDLVIVGGPPLTVVTCSGIEEELEVVEMPDRTVASGGNTKPVEFTIGIPTHHAVEIAFMELWFADSIGQKPGHKKSGALIMKAVSDIAPGKTHTIMSALVSKRKLPDLEMANEGELSVTEYTIRADQTIPV